MLHNPDSPSRGDNVKLLADIDPHSDDPDSPSSSSSSLRRPVWLVSGSFFLLFMAFNTAQALQSSLNGTLGNICLATLYGTFTVTCVVAPRVVVWLSPKFAMLVGAIPYVLMVAANLQPTYYLAVPANFLVGVGAPLLWTGQGVYIQRAALRYSQSIHSSEESSSSSSASSAMSWMNAIFFGVFQVNGVVGLILSSLILQLVGSDNAKQLLFLVLTALAGLGAASLFFLPSLDSSSSSSSKSSSSSVSLLSTVRLFVYDRRMQLMSVIILYNGLSLGFMLGDYTRFVISVSLGSDLTGYVVATFYACNAVATFIASKLTVLPSFGRSKTAACATLFHVAFYLLLLIWPIPNNFELNDDNKWNKIATASATTYVLVFSGAILFAVGDAVWESQLPALLQTLFCENDEQANAAMSNLKMWQSLGFTLQFCLGFLLASYFRIKVAIAVVLLAAGSTALWAMHKWVANIDRGQVPNDDRDGKINGC